MYGVDPLSTNTAENRFVRYPFGAADVQNIAAAAVMAATIKNSQTQLNIGELGAAGTLNLTLHPELSVGDELVIKVSADGTNRVLTLGTGITGNAITVTADKTFIITAKFDGTAFIVVSSLVTN